MPTEYTFTCATCDHPIAGRPVFHIGLTFCCAGCAADGPCMCSYDTDEPGHPKVELVAQVEDQLVEPVGGRIFAEPVATPQPVAEPAAAVKDDADQLIGAGR